LFNEIEKEILENVLKTTIPQTRT